MTRYHLDRPGLVHFNHGHAVSMDKAAFEPNALAILAAKHLESSELSRTDEKEIYSGSRPGGIDLKDGQMRLEKRAFEGPFDPKFEGSRVDGILEPCRRMKSAGIVRERTAQALLVRRPSPFGLRGYQPM